MSTPGPASGLTFADGDDEVRLAKVFVEEGGGGGEPTTHCQRLLWVAHRSTIIAPTPVSFCDSPSPPSPPSVPKSTSYTVRHSPSTSNSHSHSHSRSTLPHRFLPPPKSPSIQPIAPPTTDANLSTTPPSPWLESPESPGMGPRRRDSVSTNGGGTGSEAELEL